MIAIAINRKDNIIAFLFNMAQFSFRCRYALLTYAQCDGLDPWSIVDHLSAIPAECIIGREDHADGGTHLHVFTDFGVRFFTSDSRRFDVEGYHPNIQPCGRTPAKAFDYAIKDGDVVAGGLERPSGSELAKPSVEWDVIVDAPDVGEFWRLVRELAPRVLLTNFNSLRSYSEWRYRPSLAPYVSPTDVQFDLSGVEELDEFVRTQLSGDVVGR